ncbi:MAG: HNH endonuclease [Opitutaceae bacterium]|nr:HNH endonuclease [Opitutaceae bacterium]
MEKVRKPVPEALVTHLLVANRRTCCLCREPGHEVQIHHIDEDPANNDWDNLAVLCLNCHGRVSGKPGFGRKFTIGEVRVHKLDWERCCADAGTSGVSDDENEPDVETDHSEVRIDPDEEYIHDFVLAAGQTLVVELRADDFLDAYICEQRDYRRYERGSDLQAFVAREDIRAGRLQFDVPRDGNYCLVLMHDCEESIEVAIDTEIWPVNEDDEDTDEE